MDALARPAQTILHECPQTTCLNDFTWKTTRPDPPEQNFGFPWVHEPNKILGFLWAHDQNEGMGERQENGPHEHAEDTRAVTT